MESENEQSPIPEFTYYGTNSWHIKLYTTKYHIHGYRSGKKRIYGLVNGKLHYMTRNEAEGEPEYPVEFNYNLKD